MTRGRKPMFTQALADAVCDRLANGETIAKICSDPDMPSFVTVWKWEKEIPEFAKDSQRAREVGTHKLADECLAIADTPVMGGVEKFEMVATANPDDPEGEGVKEFQLTERRVEDMLQHRRLQIDTRLRLIGKWNAKYADKTVHSNDPENPLTSTREEIVAELAALRAKQGGA